MRLGRKVGVVLICEPASHASHASQGASHTSQGVSHESHDKRKKEK